VADIGGVRPQAQITGRTGCDGMARLQRQRKPDWQTRWMAVTPTLGASAAAGVKASFSGAGICVGVIAGGYGSQGMLGFLQQSKGMDADSRHTAEIKLRKEHESCALELPNETLHLRFQHRWPGTEQGRITLTV